MSSSSVVSLTAILALTSVARGAEIKDADGQSSESLEKETRLYDANRYTRAQRYQQNHSSTRQQRRIANNKQRRLVNRRRRKQQHTNKQKQSHRQAQFASTSQRPQQPNTTYPQSNTQTTSQTTTTQLAAPKCGPTSGTHHSPYIGCYTDKLNDRIMSFELPGKYHSVLTCEKICSDRKVPRLYCFIFYFVYVG